MPYQFSYFLLPWSFQISGIKSSERAVKQCIPIHDSGNPNYKTKVNSDKQYNKKKLILTDLVNIYKSDKDLKPFRGIIKENQ